MIPNHPRVSPIPFASHALQLLQRVQHGMSSVELVYTTHESWPLRPEQLHTRPLRISVLDSSFNPPTKAHLALANSFRPSSLGHHRPSASDPSLEAYDARLLLLSVRNADKSSKTGDATFLQRLEMMRLLSDDIHSSDLSGSLAGGESSRAKNNVAIAIIDEPIFVRKSTLLLHFLRTKLAALVESSSSLDTGSISDDGALHQFSPELTFLMGSDTLVRLFSPVYYPSERAMLRMLQQFLSPDEEGCCIVCANRGTANLSAAGQDRAPEITHEFVSSGRITFIDIDTEEQTCSSTEIRSKVAGKDGSWRRLVTDAIADYIVTQEIYSG